MNGWAKCSRRRTRRGNMATAFGMGLGAATAISFVLGLLVGLLGGSSGSGDPEEQVSAQVDQLFAALEEGRFADTYRERTSIQFRESVRQNDYLELGDMISSRYGALKEKTVQSFDSRPRPGGGMDATATYDARFEKGPGVIAVEFRKVDKRWLLMNFAVQPPAGNKGK